MAQIKFTAAVIGALLLSNPAHAIDIVVSSKADVQEAVAACAKIADATACERYLSGTDAFHRALEERLYDAIIEMDDNKKHLGKTFGLKDPQAKQYYDSRFVTKSNKSMDIDSIAKTKITIEWIGSQFAWRNRRSSKYGYFRLYKWLQADFLYGVRFYHDGKLISQSVIENSDVVMSNSLCDREKRRNKCLSGMPDQHRGLAGSFFAHDTLGQNNPKGHSLTSDRVNDFAMSLMMWPNGPFSDSVSPFGTETHQPGRDIMYIVREYEPGDWQNRYFTGRVDTPESETDPAILSEYQPTSSGRARFAWAKAKLFVDAPQSAALSDPRYAGDVQRCIVEVRNSMRADRTTGSVLSGLASVLGAGNVSRAISTANSASATLDNLSGAERTKVDACMNRKGHN